MKRDVQVPCETTIRNVPTAGGLEMTQRTRYGPGSRATCTRARRYVERWGYGAGEAILLGAGVVSVLGMELLTRWYRRRP